MTSTIGITIGSGSAAAAIAATGAIGLGILGVGALLRGRGRKKGGGRKKKKTYHGRYSRRAEEEEEEEVEDVPEDLEEALNVIRSQDVTGCGLRLVCQLAGRRDQLTLEEAAILQIVGPAVKPGEGLLHPGAPEEYRAAKGLGQAGGDCVQAFPMCSLNGTQLMDTVMAYLP